jgi:SPP1 gp7 family putative phage head morphogenesis protein
MMDLVKFFKKEQDLTLPLLGTEISHAGSSYYVDWTLRPYNPAELYQKRGNYDLYDEIREDDQVKAVLSLKKIMVLNSEWEIDSENEEISGFLTACLSEYYDGLFNKSLYEILSAIDYGWSLTEKIFDYAETDYGNKIILKRLKTRPPHTFDLYTDNFGNIEKIIQHIDAGDLVFTDMNKFIVYSYHREFEDPYGNSDINKGVYRAWWSKDAIIKFWNIYCERFGMPTHVGKMPRSAGESEKELFKKIIKNIQAKSGITIPEDFSLELLGVSTSSSSEYEKAINRYDTMIARAALVPDLIGLSGAQTSGGSYALGKEQFNIFYSTIFYLRNDIERLINKEIIQPLIYMNYGVKEKAYFKFNTIDEERKKQDLLMWLDAVKSGKIPITSKQINWFLGQVNAPELDEVELQKIEEEKQAFKDKLIGQDQGNKEQNQQDKGQIDNKDRGNEQDQNTGQDKKEYTLDREKTKYEKKCNFVKMENDFNALSEKYLPVIGDQYKLIINALVDEIRRRKIIENKRIDLVNKLELKYMKNAEKIWRDLLKDAYGNGTESAEKPRKEYNIQSVVGLDDEDIATWLSENAAYVNNIEGTTILNKVKTVLMDGIRSGMGVQQMIKQLSDMLEPWEILQLTTDKNGNTLQTESRLEGIIRTNINKAYNEARSVQYENMSEEIRAYQYSAIMDGRTSPICSALDGKVFKPEELAYYNPPNHINCRSVVLPVFIDEEFDGFSQMPGTEQVSGSFLELS